VGNWFPKVGTVLVQGRKRRDARHRGDHTARISESASVGVSWKVVTTRDSSPARCYSRRLPPEASSSARGRRSGPADRSCRTQPPAVPLHQPEQDARNQHQVGGWNVFRNINRARRQPKNAKLHRRRPCARNGTGKSPRREATAGSVLVHQPVLEQHYAGLTTNTTVSPRDSHAETRNSTHRR